MNGLKYLHIMSILHNDIKGDNILVGKTSVGVRSVITDLGKGCYIRNANRSHSKKSETLPQIAPDLEELEMSMY